MTEQIKFCCICCTYLRPEPLGNVIKCFEEQDYPAHLRELIILDDVGQYTPAEQRGPGWQLVSFNRRFRTLGEKRNCTAALASPDVNAYAVWDDDDAYLPWHLSVSAKALKDYDLVVPGHVWIEKNGGLLERKKSKALFHGGWTFRREAFDKVDGYPFMQSGQDQCLFRRLVKAGVRRGGTMTIDPRPSYIYRWFTAEGHLYHLSAMNRREGYEKLAKRPVKPHGHIQVKYQRDWPMLFRRAMKIEASKRAQAEKGKS